MEVDTDNAMERLGFIPQSEVVYNRHLPYADTIDNESQLALTTIKLNLKQAVLMRDMRPAVIYWTSQLSRYIRLYGLKFSKQDHILFINLYYELVTLPDLEGVLVDRFITVLVKLLKKRELLSRCDLTLDWKPIYKLCERLAFSKMEPMGLEWIPQNIDRKLRSLVRNVRSLFPSESTQDMLDEWRPLLCPYDIVMTKGCRYLDWFLPTLVFTEEEQNISWRLWLKEFLALWENVRNGPSWEKHFVNLFARLAHNNIGKIDWGPYADILFTRILRSFNLPVGKLQHTTALAQTVPMETSALWIVSMMGGSATKMVLNRLKCLFDATESYFHPSNYGKWVTHLVNFLQQLATKFAERLHRESHKKVFWEPKIPETHLIQDEDIYEFVTILKPVTLLTLYSKIGSVSASQILQILSYLKPEIVIPSLLEKTYIALETLTEPHQARACLSALSSSLHPALHGYPEIRRHVLPLLFQCLPAIDANDLPKSMYAFQFVSTCMTLIPVVDCSNAPQHHKDLSEEDREVCFATSQFEDFVLQFIDRCFVFLESLNQEHGSRTAEHVLEAEEVNTQSENIADKLLASSTTIMMQQSSLPIFKRCLEKIFRFATTSLLEGNTAVAAASHLFVACAKANPKESYAMFVPHYCDVITRYFEENPEAVTEEKVDRKLLWDLTILSEVCHAGSEHLLTYKDMLFPVIKLILSMYATQGYSLGSKLLKFCIMSWSNYYNKEVKSVSHSQEPDPSSYLALDDWGYTTNPWEMSMKWHVPSKQELVASFEVLETFLQPELETLVSFNKGEKELSKENLLKVLHVINELLSGASLLLPMEKSDNIEIPSNSTMQYETWPIHVMENLQYYNDIIKEKNASGLRKQVFEIIRETLRNVMTTREDDVKSVSTIIRIYSQCALMHEQQKLIFDHNWKIFSAYKSLKSNPLLKNKQRSRICLIDRIVLQHAMRVLAVSRWHYTSMHHAIMMDLIWLSTSHYMKVRRSAQAVFFHGMTLMPYNAYKLYLPVILKNIKKSESNNHQQYKGALYLLLGKPKGRQFLGYFHNWEVMKEVWPALINAPHSEKRSITKLFDRLAIKVQTNFNTVGIGFKFTDNCVSAATALKPAITAHSDTDQNGLNHLQQSNEHNYKGYLHLVNSLTELYETGDLTWKNKQLALGMISLMLRHDVEIPARVTRLFVSLLIDDTLSVRRLAIGCVASLMKKQKRNHVFAMKTLHEITGVSPDQANIIPGDRSDNKWHQFDENNLPDTREKYNNTVFVDKTHWGYYCWPKMLKTYESFEKQPKLDRSRDELSEHEQIVYDLFSDAAFVEKFLTFLCVENVKGKDKFDTKRMDLFRGLFRNFGDTFVPLFKGHIQRLVEEKQETHQRCAAEIVTGMVMGSKHWTFDKVQSMWEWVIPVLRAAVANISAETMKDWDQAFGHIVQNRDPRRIHWVLKFLVEEPERPSASSLIHSSKLYVLQGGIHQQEWRTPQLLQRILDQVEPLMSHPYKSLRNRVGSLLASVFLYDISLVKTQSLFRTPQVDRIIERLLPQFESLMSEDTPPLSSSSSGSPGSCDDGNVTPATDFTQDLTSLTPPLAAGSISPEMLEQIQIGLKKMLPPGSPIPSNLSDIETLLPRNFLRSLVAEKSDDVREPVDDSMTMTVDMDSERSAAIRSFKSTLKWLVSAQRSMLQPFRASLLRLLPVICKMYPATEKQAVQAVDEELHKDTRLCLSCLAQCLVPDADIMELVAEVESISTSSSWHARYSVLPYIQVFVYSNLFSVLRSDACRHTLLHKVILPLLKDKQLEVSHMASVTLSGLIQCRVIPCDVELMTSAFDLCKTKLKKSERSAATSQAASEKLQSKILLRHAGVLILSACVLSSPYTVPDWMPGVLMRLGSHLADPQPVKGTVQRALSEFKRTHHDNWHEDKQKFTSDELSTLTDLLVSPSYYA